MKMAEVPKMKEGEGVARREGYLNLIGLIYWYTYFAVHLCISFWSHGL